MSNAIETLRASIDLTGPSCAVVGDAMLDAYTWGDVTRVSPEAPVPIVNYQRQSAVPGGAANAAACVAALGAPTRLIAKVGADLNGSVLDEGLVDAGVELVRLGSDEPTTTKHRIWAAGQQLIRVDTEVVSAVGAFPDAVTDAVMSGNPDVVLVSDYGKGVANPEALAALFAQLRERRIPSVVDPKDPDFARYRGCTCIKPNEREARDAFTARFGRDGTIEEIGEYLIDEIADEAVITLGGRGMYLVQPHGGVRVDAVERNVYDVTGAGDVVAAILAYGYGSGWPTLLACEIASAAASVVVSKKGTTTVGPHEILAALELAEAPEPTDDRSIS